MNVFTGFKKTDTSQVKNSVNDPEKYKTATGVFADTLKDTGKNEAGDVLYPVDSQIEPQIFSSESADAPFETLFDSFDLLAFSFYNFWTADEETNDRQDLENRKLEDVPRFVKLSWIRSPEIYEPNDQYVDVSKKKVDGVIFSREIDRKNVFIKNGLTFAPDHLQSDGFSKVKNFSANGFVSPGVVEAVVEMKTGNNQKKGFDEDSFLTSDVNGVSVHELLAQDMSVEENTKISFGERGERIKSSSSKIVDSFSFDKRDESSVQVKVKFVNPAIAGIVSEEKVAAMSSPEHVESMVSIASILSQLETLSQTNMKERTKVDDIPSFPSPKTKKLEYIGYVIEKYMMSNNGVFIKIDEIDINNREVDYYIDTKVLYGKTYRYRIKCLLRWTRESDVGIKGKDKSSSPRHGDGTTKLANYKSSYFSSEWSKKWGYASCVDREPPSPPDELTVRPESHRKRIVITFRIPDDHQRDISRMILLRKTKDQDGKDSSDWQTIFDTGSEAKNVIFFDDRIETGKRYVYACQSFSKHGEESVLSEQLCTRTNEKYRIYGEYPVEFISSPGVLRSNFGAFSTIPYTKTKTQIIMKQNDPVSPSNLVVSGRDSNNSTIGSNASYVFRIQSLDTGETRDIPVSVVFKTTESRVLKESGDVIVSTENQYFHGRENKKQVSVEKREDVLPKDRAGKGDRW